MNRRQLLMLAGGLPLMSTAHAQDAKPFRRVRPGDPAWPSAAQWDELNAQVGVRLVAVRPPLEACRAAPEGAECAALFRGLKNPWYIGDNIALTQTSGWVDAWTSTPSAYAVAARNAADAVIDEEEIRPKKAPCQSASKYDRAAPFSSSSPTCRRSGGPTPQECACGSRMPTRSRS